MKKQTGREQNRERKDREQKGTQIFQQSKKKQKRKENIQNREHKKENTQRHTRSEDKTKKKNKSNILFSKFHNKEKQKKGRNKNLSNIAPVFTMNKICARENTSSDAPEELQEQQLQGET